MKNSMALSAVLLAWWGVASLDTPIVKLGRDGRCYHDQQQIYHSVRYYQPFPSLEACLNANLVIREGRESSLLPDQLAWAAHN